MSTTEVHSPRLRDLPAFWRQNPRPFILRACVAFVLLSFYVISTVRNIDNERQLIIDDIERISRVTTNSAQLHTHAIFDATVHTLTALRSDLESTTAARGPQQLLDDHFFYSPYLRTILLLNEQGDNIASNYREIVGSDGVGYQFFEVHRNGQAGAVFTGDIIVGRVSRSAHFLSSVALRNAQGDFEGVLAAAYELAYFKDLYAQLVPDRNYTVALYHMSEGLVVAGDSQIAQGSLPTSSRFPLHLPDYQSGFQRIDPPQSPGGDIIAFTVPLADANFRITTFADTEALLANHVRSNQNKYLLTAVVIMMVLGLMVMLELYNARRMRSELENTKLEEDLRHAQKLEALGTLAGGLAHDFNNLLSSIIGFGELAKERLQAARPADEALDQVLLAGRRAESMVDRILTFSRRSETRRVAFRLGPIVSEALELVKVSMSPSIKVEKHIAARELWILGDPNQLHQLIMNLCMNAIQAMPGGGVLHISVQHEYLDAKRSAARRLSRAGEYLKLIVRDTGIGIPEHVQRRMFDPFFTTKENEKGSGLGLSIVHGIVMEHRGGISVNSEPGSGSEFLVWLPAIDPPDGEADPLQSRSQVDGQGRIAVFVDDDEAIVMLMEERLAEFGFEPRVFDDSRDAYDFIVQHAQHVALLITDYSMPKMTGLELASAVRKQNPEMPVILTTGFSTNEVVEEAKRIGIREVVYKPLRVRKLANAIARSLGDDGARAQL